LLLRLSLDGFVWFAEALELIGEKEQIAKLYCECNQSLLSPDLLDLSPLLLKGLKKGEVVFGLLVQLMDVFSSSALPVQRRL